MVPSTSATSWDTAEASSRRSLPMASTSDWHASGVADRPVARNSCRTKASRSAGLVIFGQATSRAPALRAASSSPLPLTPCGVQQHQRDLLGGRPQIRLDVLDRVGGQVVRVAYDHDLAFREERGAGQLGERAGLHLVRGQVAHVRVGVGGPGGGHHLLHGTVEQEVLLAHGKRQRGERVVIRSLPCHHRKHPTSH